MILIFKKAISIIFTSYYRMNKNIDAKNSTMLFSQLSTSRKNRISLLKASKEILSRVHISGENNHLINYGYLFKTKISIIGNNNCIFFDKGVEFNKSEIIVRGSNCKITVKKDSTFGGIYMICMGNNNYIEIGENCMFSKNIEIWATDSHPIYNDAGQIINKSKPILIEDKVWIGSNVCILKNVRIETGCIVGMASVVSRSLPKNSICAGNPARMIRNDVARWERSYINI